jgi:hypothetical protein
MSEQFPTLEAMKLARRWLLANPDKVPYYVNGQRRHGTLDSLDDVRQLASYHEASEVLAARPGWLLGFALGPDGTGENWQGIDLDKIVANQLADLGRTRSDMGAPSQRWVRIPLASRRMRAVVTSPSRNGASATAD